MPGHRVTKGDFQRADTEPMVLLMCDDWDLPLVAAFDASTVDPVGMHPALRRPGGT